MWFRDRSGEPQHAKDTGGTRELREELLEWLSVRTRIRFDQMVLEKTAMKVGIFCNIFSQAVIAHVGVWTILGLHGQSIKYDQVLQIQTQMYKLFPTFPQRWIHL